MSKINELTPEDKKLFKEAMKEVKPLSISMGSVKIQKKNNNAEYRRQAASKELKSLLGMPLTHKQIPPSQSYVYSQQGVSERQLKQLRQGKLPIDACIDLHGLRVSEAESTLATFFADCREYHFRCVKIIHGKGTDSPDKVASLQNLVYQCLEQHPHVIAFCSAHPRDGGWGATYALIRNFR